MAEQTTDGRFYELAATSAATELRRTAADLRDAVWTILTDTVPEDPHDERILPAIRTIAQAADTVSAHAGVLDGIHDHAAGIQSAAESMTRAVER